MSYDTPLRADAQRNRERILEAAEAVFLERGSKATLDDVAKRANVGIGTLYRRFATRDDLLAAAYSARFLAFAEDSQRRSHELAPASALRVYLEELVTHSNIYRGLASSLGTILTSGTPGCMATADEGKRLLSLAQKQGSIRSDILFEDLVCVVQAVCMAVVDENNPKRRTTHLIGLFIDGLEAKR
ncbi:helix-turn-helix domain-containing protein [Dyella sp.]|uniref:TetR/AcrR family transcriptional regulator n=1 Tax=Dyella sp. TaxID=1869338 RepID=UPI002ED45443